MRVWVILKMPTSLTTLPGFESWLCSQLQLPAKPYPGRPQMMAEILGSIYMGQARGLNSQFSDLGQSSFGGYRHFAE